MQFKLNAKFTPKGDQPKAIEKLVEGLQKGDRYQTLLGVTGSGKTFTIANVIEKVQKPTLIIAHNKTLAAQLCSEFRTFFPDAAVEYFVSYYDYYQPEAYLPNTDVYIEKDLEINMEIERLRHAATQALIYRKDVIIVASVSCIYGLGNPDVYKKTLLTLGEGFEESRDYILQRLVEMYFTRSEVLERGKFRVHGQTLEIMPADQEVIIRVEFDGDLIAKITRFEAVSMKNLGTEKSITIYPAKHFVVDDETTQKAITQIEKELEERLDVLEKNGKLLEAERLRRRTKYDLEMMREIGYCSGIENYSRYLTNREPGTPPYTLLDFFPKDFLMVIDESHVTVPQIGAMFEGDKSRKTSLIDYGFRLPSAYDNRPLKFPEFESHINQLIFTSATPGKYEKEKSEQVVEQIIRPTGLVDPETEIRPTENQIQNLIPEIVDRAKKKERVLVTTLTKKMAEELSEYLKEAGVKAEYLHSEVDTLDRVGILENLRRGTIDCLVGVNLLREGLDLPEVTLVAILDADKEGFLRSDVSLIQTIGRAARNVKGKVILYADRITGSMKRALDETDRRRARQIKYNIENKITPKTIEKAIESIVDHELNPQVTREFIDLESIEDLPAVIRQKTDEMKIAAKNLEFEKAAVIRDEVVQLRKLKIK
ncbi:TPA: excinuclease ABC subunit UvrB [Candidatus Berkelbacteria bacterium]|uniref:UvrABC system protein B n=1 Tax=Berkelbacteria bacterium GW2011_GWE1_39_12 TaxID=1618337 RepID=A0A0G4B2C0_9BACT|nr:MAG: excinuclease ABC subunit B, excinuclease ABC subunit B [Berkelbacteria bacterium GW2011_GWE1_39_12]HBO60608.1 excinuclease ABC subunit UvrB [Candidatus Berkelbacteria bacterium]